MHAEQCLLLSFSLWWSVAPLLKLRHSGGLQRLSRQSARGELKTKRSLQQRRGNSRRLPRVLSLCLAGAASKTGWTGVNFCAADLPTHCLVKHVLGEWEAATGMWLPCKQQPASTGEEKEPETLARLLQHHDPYCGYFAPDKVGAHGPVTPPDLSSSFHELEKFRFTLEPDSSVTLSDGSKGVWSLIYDEGLLMDVHHPRRRRYFAFLKYTTTSDEENLAWSYCHTTLLGWIIQPGAAPEGNEEVEHQGRHTQTQKTADLEAPKEEEAEHEKVLRIKKHRHTKTQIQEKNKRKRKKRRKTTGKESVVAVVVAAAVPEATEALRAYDERKRLCWWGRKLGEDLTIPTNEVPKQRRPPIYVPLWPSSRPPDIRAVVAKVKKDSGAGVSWEPVKNDYIELHGRKLYTLEEVLRQPDSHTITRRGLLLLPTATVAGNSTLGLATLKHAATSSEESLVTDDVRDEESPAAAETFTTAAAVVPTTSSPASSLTEAAGIWSSAEVAAAPWKYIREFDWTNPEHVYKRIGRRASVVPDPPAQGDCGSCYALATGTVLTSRLWIKYAGNDDVFQKIAISPYQGISCSVYNQGCEGGYVELALLFAQEKGLRSEECLKEYFKKHKRAPPRSMAATQTCHDLGGQLGLAAYGCKRDSSQQRQKLPAACDYTTKVSSWKYVTLPVTPAQSAADEMLQALWEYGPLAASIEPPHSFLVYGKGVYQSPYNRLVEAGDSWLWERVDHAIVIVGWGWEKQGDMWLPYWKIRNSWGRNWGEEGHARIVRGVNEMGIERIAITADVRLFFKNKPVSPRTMPSISSTATAAAFVDLLLPSTLVGSNSKTSDSHHRRWNRTITEHRASISPHPSTYL